MPTGKALLKVFTRIRTSFLALGVVVLACVYAWASGISIPDNSRLNVNSGELHLELALPGHVTNSGVIKTTTGKVRLNGDWNTLGTGYYDAGTGTVVFLASGGLETITPGSNVSDAFYNLTHAGAATLKVVTNALNIRGGFTNQAGIFDANGLTMNVGGDWANTSAAAPSFIPNGNIVHLNGADQQILGQTTFYEIDKQIYAGPSVQLTLPSGLAQTITHKLTLRGSSDVLLALRKGAGTDAAQLKLLSGGLQDIARVDVQDNDASGGLTLVARSSPDHAAPAYKTTNWAFGSVTVKWDGSDDTRWDNPYNWNLGIVPESGDTAIIRSVDEDNANAPIPHQPVLAHDVTVGVLQIRNGAGVDLAQHNMTVQGALTNAGTITLAGNETVTAASLADTGTFRYVGMTNGTLNAVISGNFIIGGTALSTYHALVVEEQNVSSQRDTFTIASDLSVTTDAVFTAGAVAVASGKKLSVGGGMTVNGATFDASMASVDTFGFVLSGGSFSAPGAAGIFTVSGDFTHSAGTFTPNDGTLTLDGTSTVAPSIQTLKGSTGFYSLVKTIPSGATQPHTLTFWSGDIFMVSRQLTMTGLDGSHRLNIDASTSGSAASLRLLTGGGQNIQNVAVRDNNALSGLLLVARGDSQDISNNTHWAFGAATLRWVGSVSDAWADPFNWDLGMVPIPNDTVVIRAEDEDNGNAPLLHQPLLSADVAVGSMNIRDAAASVTLNGHGLQVKNTAVPPGVFQNNGTVYLNGTETLDLAAFDTDSGTFAYRGDGAGGGPFNISGNGRPAAFFNLVIQPPPAGAASTFAANNDLTVNGALTVSGAALNAAGSSVAVVGSFTETGGTFTAPGSAKSFTIAGDFVHSAGVFNANGGTVTLNGTSSTAASSQLLGGNTTFYNLLKTVPAGAVQVHRLTFDHAATATVAHTLTLRGITGNALQIRSDSVDPAPAVRSAQLLLQTGGTQNIGFVDVQDSDASGGVTLLARDSDDHSNPSYNTTNWIFGIPTVTWTGVVSTDWADPLNWDLGLVPSSGDDALIRAAANQPHLTAASGAVSLRNLSLEGGTSLALDGYGLAITAVLSNSGSIVLRGSEPVAIHTPDTDSGTFVYTGADAGAPIILPAFDPAHAALIYFNLVIAATGAVDTFRPATDLVIHGGLTVNGGVLDAAGISMTLAGNLALNGGTLSAPGSGKTFTVGGDWARTLGVFTPDGGRVTLSGPATATMSGDTGFYDLATSVPVEGKTIHFTAGSDQTVAHTLDLNGNAAAKLVLRSSADGTPWTLTLPSGYQVVRNVDVRDAVAVVAGVRPYVLALDSIDQQNSGVSTNKGWLFAQLLIIAPAEGRTVDPDPTVIGRSVPSEAVSIMDKDGVVVATARADVNGNFRVVVGHDDAALGTVIRTSLATGANEIMPSFDGHNGTSAHVTVTAATTPVEVPVIVGPVDGTLLIEATPTITGQGKPGQTVVVVASDLRGQLLLTLPPEAYAGQGTVGADGLYAVTLTRPLVSGVNYVSVVVDGVSSRVLSYVIRDLQGVVFDATNNHLIKNASVSLIKPDGTLARPGTDLDAADVNPFVTGADGIYYFVKASGIFTFKVDAAGYDYPSQTPDDQMPAGRFVVKGSRGEEVSTVGLIMHIDQPLDANPHIFKVEKKANKAQAKIGEVVTYTVTIENLLTTPVAASANLVDKIPPGFKFMPGRAQLDGLPVPDPAGMRPLILAVGDFAAGQKKAARYQLVIGAGVAPGNYDNVAYMAYTNGRVVSNRASASVQLVLDPLFDAGTVFGKVFYDWNENGKQDAPDYVAEDREEVVESPVPNVRLVMEDGTVVTADKNGQFSIPALLPGRHLVRLDERSLPPGAYLTTDKVQVVDVTAGSIVKVNFGVNTGNSAPLGKDDTFFQNDLVVEQNAAANTPRLNVRTFNENILLHNDTVIEQVEFRMFTNYAAFLISWELEVRDRDTHKVVRSFTGTRQNIYDPVYWDGRDKAEKYIRQDRHYTYVFRVRDAGGKWDETAEKDLALNVLTDAEMSLREHPLQGEVPQAVTRADQYRVFLQALAGENNLKTHNIWVKGETVVLKPVHAGIRQVRVLKGGELFTEVPVLEYQGVTARQLLASSAGEQALPMEIILPDGDYELDVMTAAAQGPALPAGANVAALASSSAEAGAAAASRYKKPLKVGEDYMMFVAMGDGKAGYNTNRGNIEPVQGNEAYKPGFYKEGKLAYYLKGKVQGKYVVTSSFDTQRLGKQALRTFRDEDYYPVYGDASTVNYDATDTQGPLYLAVDWDKSQAIWGNYAVAFNDNEFANYTRSLYGGKLDYKTVATTDYGEPKTNIVVFHAEVRERSAHNEFLATGGSLYYLKSQDVVKGTDKVRVEVRDAVTGLVKSTVEMKSGVDYEMDNANGRMLFWRPVSMSVAGTGLISNGLLNGDPVYVVADYEYFTNDTIANATNGTRVAQALGKDVVVGGTYVSEAQADRNYELKGTDVTMHMGKDATVKGEYAQSLSAAGGNYISSDGGITFSELSVADNTQGQAYGISQDARLFDRVGLKSYYKWIGDGFSTSGTTSQQGKEMKGMAMTFDLTPVTRLTASRDIQRLITRGNLQTAMQVGAQETTTSMVQIVQDARRLRLSAAFQSTQVKAKDDTYQSGSNQEANTLAVKADYVLNEKTDLTLSHQADVAGGSKQTTTAGVTRRLSDRLSGSLEGSVGTEGLATKAGLSANVTPKLALTSDYTVTKVRNGGIQHTAALGGKGQINDKTSLQATASVTQSAAGAQENTVALGGTTKMSTDTDVKMGVESTQSSDAAKSRQALALEGARQGADGHATTGGVKIQDSLTSGKQTVISAGEAGQMTPDSRIAAERSFAFGTNSQEQDNTYKITRTQDGRNVETSYARRQTAGTAGVSDSNIFGLSGDVNDRVAVQASLEKGKAMDVDGSIYDRVALSGGLGYVAKDPSTGEVSFQSSTKGEVRVDTGSTDRQQYVLYQSAEGKPNDQSTVRVKVSYSTTHNSNTGKAEAGYKEIMLGGAYRPVAMDRLNAFGEYTYKENQGPAGQTTATDVTASKMHVVTAGAAYELNARWDLVEKLAMRIMEEKVTGFEFTKTHTWLMVHRVNYAINQDWKIGAEYRMLTVQEAKDKKSGVLLEAVHHVNDNVELGIGYNFTNFVDDLTNLGYTAQGPFMRMTGKLYDQTPQERARAKARWLDRRVELYAARMVKREFERKDSQIVAELNERYKRARIAAELGKYDEAQHIYKNIIQVTRMMYEEAAQFVRHHIDFEERVYNAFQRAEEYYHKGELWQARKLWEKIVEEASKAVLE